MYMHNYKLAHDKGGHKLHLRRGQLKLAGYARAMNINDKKGHKFHLRRGKKKLAGYARAIYIYINDKGAKKFH